MDKNTKGLFITFEGGEGTGKTTQSKMLSEHLNSIGVKSIWTREIGGVEVAEEIRNIFFKYDIDCVTEYFLSTAARNEHVIHKIRPNINNDVAVICDRFIDTSSVYRSVFGDFTQEEIYLDHHRLFPDCWPDITFLLDIDPKIASKRMSERAGEKSKYDEATLEMHELVRKAFLHSASLYPNRFVIIDADQSLESVHQSILDNVLKFVERS